jgi:polygalacturonase
MNNRDSNKIQKTKFSTNRIFLVLFCFCLLVITAGRATAGWEQVGGILSRIKPPRFPDRTFTVTDYGAVGDNEKDCTGAFEKAILAAHQAGGGRVVVPPGTFLTGPIHLKSNVNLYVSDGAVINFFVDPNKYMPVVYTRFEGIECMNYSPLVYACEQENIAITGKGVLDGRASDENWWRWKRSQSGDVKTLGKMGDTSVPVSQRIFGAGRQLRPNMIQTYKCKNVLIEGVTIKNSPMWHIHPVLSTNVTVRNVQVIGHGPNNDGRRVNTPSENIIIRNCQMKDGHGGVVIGSETSGGTRNVFAENCSMDSRNLDRALRIKTNSVRGGTIEKIYLRNIKIGQVAEAVLKVNFQYGEGDAGDFTPIVRNINMENVTSGKSRYALSISGYERSPITGIRLKNCIFNNVEKNNVLIGVKNLTMENVKINSEIQK